MKRNQLLAGILLGMSFYVLPCSFASAEIETIEATGSYTVGDSDTENFSVAREKASQEAMREAVEKAGIYVESYSKTQNMQLTQDEVRTVSGNILKIISKDIRPIVSADGHTIQFVCTIRATVDTDSINLREKMHQKEVEEENKNLREEIAKLKLQLRGSIPADDINSLRQKAESGDKVAQFDYAVRLYNGSGVKKDIEEALKWWQKAAEQGDAASQYNLGILYEIDEGVSKDEKKAVKWYRKAAEQGVANAQYNLGNCYYNGAGITRDYTEAVKWYRKAAEQGYVLAEEALSRLNSQMS